ncbi:hypothetical protein EHI48_29145 [Rhizobium sp. WSM1325]|nr:hypothetical protein EHI48_29145 [Rhizobium leguminosarum]
MEIGCGKPPNGSGCTIASLFPKKSCWSTSTGLQRFQRRDPGACEGIGCLQWPAISDAHQSFSGRSMRDGSPGRRLLFVGCLAASTRTGAITPLLGGVGPLTIISLMHNTLIAASMLSGLGVPLLRQM